MNARNVVLQVIVIPIFAYGEDVCLAVLSLRQDVLEGMNVRIAHQVMNVQHYFVREKANVSLNQNRTWMFAGRGVATMMMVTEVCANVKTSI